MFYKIRIEYRKGKQTVEDKYIKVIESLGEIISNRDMVINEQRNEIEELKRKVKMIEEYMDYYKDENRRWTNWNELYHTKHGIVLLNIWKKFFVIWKIQ